MVLWIRMKTQAKKVNLFQPDAMLLPTRFEVAANQIRYSVSIPVRGLCQPDAAILPTGIVLSSNQIRTSFSKAAQFDSGISNRVRYRAYEQGREAEFQPDAIRSSAFRGARKLLKYR
jgi:hypothetical protein